MTIVMPVLDEAGLLADRLAALQPLRARGVRVVVADGGSRDASLAIAQQGADTVLKAPRGRAAQMNAGAAGIDHGVLWFVHADTQLPADADAQVRAAVAAGHVWGRFDVRLGATRQQQRPDSSPAPLQPDGASPLLRLVGALMNLRSRWTGIATGDQAMFVTAEAFHAVGGFPDIALMEDIALSRRLKRRGPPACLRARVTPSARRWERHGAWRTIGLMWGLRAAYFFGADPARLARRYGYAPPVHIAVLAKAPVAGAAKTRLMPAVGAAGAARLQRRLTLQALRTARLAAGASHVTLWCAPGTSHRFFRALARCHGIDCRAQPGGDLGQRMQAAFEHHLPAGPLLLIGTDCPALTADLLRDAAQALYAGADATVCPAEDGGYVLIGLRHDAPARWLPLLFADMPWSTDRLMTVTRERLQACGAHWQQGPLLWDVDRPDDLARWQRLEADRPIAGATDGD